MSYFINVSLLKKNKDFRLLFIGQSVSFIGTMITGVALPYQIYHETHSTLMVGLLSLAQLLPLLFTALLGGTLADRHHRRKLLFFTESLLSLGSGLLAWNSLLITPSLWLLFIVASIMSAITGLHRPALTSLTQQVVSKEYFPAASALNAFTFSSCMIIGPAVGGWLIGHAGLTVTYLIDLSTFIISLITLILMRDLPKPNGAQDQSTLSALKQGLQYARSRQELLGSYIVDFLAMIFGMPMALFPAIAEHFGGASTLGLLYAAPAAGAVVISLFSGWVSQIKRYGVAIAISAIWWGIAIVLFGLAPYLWLGLFFLALAGAFDALSGIFRNILWNETIPTHLRGRLAGIEMISYLSGPKLGDTEAGLVAALIGISGSIISGGILCIISVGVSCFLLPHFWYYQAADKNEKAIPPAA